MTNTKIKNYLGRGEGSREVRICRNGEVHTRGSRDAFDRDHDRWIYYGTVDDVRREIERGRR